MSDTQASKAGNWWDWAANQITASDTVERREQAKKIMHTFPGEAASEHVIELLVAGATIKEPVAATPPPSPAAEVLRDELLRLIKEGDPKKGGALTSMVLLRVMKVAQSGRELLVSLKVNPKNLAGLVGRPRGIGGGPLMPDLMIDEDGNEWQPASGAGPALSVAPFATAPPNENFGMVAIREIISLAKNFHGPSPAKLVEALAVAKEKGLDDVAKQLEDQLKELSDKPEPSVPEPAAHGPKEGPLTPPVTPTLPPAPSPA